MANVDATLSAAREEIRPSLSEDDIDLLFDNWLNANFDRIEIRKISEHSYTAAVVPRRQAAERSAESEAAQRKTRDSIASRIATDVKASLFDEFSARIWETTLPNGTLLKDATGADMLHAGGWYAELAKRLKPTEKAAKHFTTRQLFDLSQRKVFGVAA